MQYTKILLSFILLCLNIEAHAQTPGLISDLKVWLRGDSNHISVNDMVDTLFDLSGNDYHFYREIIS